MTSKLEIKDVLLALDTKNKKYFSTLSEEHKKQLSMWTLMRFASSTNSNCDYSTVIVNELVNENFTALYKHPELQWLLFTMCGLGSKQFHGWIQPPRKKAKNAKQQVLNDLYSGLNSLELDILEKSMSADDFENLLKSHGYTDKEIRDILK